MYSRNPAQAGQNISFKCSQVLSLTAPITAQKVPPIFSYAKCSIVPAADAKAAAAMLNSFLFSQNIHLHALILCGSPSVYLHINYLKPCKFIIIKPHAYMLRAASVMSAVSIFCFYTSGLHLFHISEECLICKSCFVYIHLA